jgi:hypothetical protein
MLGMPLGGGFGGERLGAECEAESEKTGKNGERFHGEMSGEEKAPRTFKRKIRGA